MGKPLFNFESIPLSRKIDTSNISLDVDENKFTDGFCVNIGNPHIIFFVKNCFEHDLKIIGPKIENNNLFPEKTNVTFAQILDKKNVIVNVWERGAGLTKACGTAACATVIAGFKKKLINNKVDVKFNEGLLNIEINSNDNVFMTGPVSKIENINIEI